MLYETFKARVLENLTKDIPDPKSIAIHPVAKNNGCTLDGLVIMENKCNISPTIYLNYYYEHLIGGVSFETIYDHILRAYRMNRPDHNVDAGFFTDFSRIRSSILFKLVNYEKNRALLEDVPHIRFLDLAIVFYCLLSMNGKVDNATILIRTSHADHWGVTAEQLYALARLNTPVRLSVRIRDLDTLLHELTLENGLDCPAVDSSSNVPMIVLTNSSSLFGAACILYEDLLKTIADEMHTDFYILPSSVHEVILIPATEHDLLEDFSSMVHDVNETQLAREEVLSDHAYYYARETDQITM